MSEEMDHDEQKGELSYKESLFSLDFLPLNEREVKHLVFLYKKSCRQSVGGIVYKNVCLETVSSRSL